MRPRGLEVAAADLELATSDQHMVGVVRRDGAQRSRAGHVGLGPIAARDQRLDLVADEGGRIERVLVAHGECRRRETGRLPRPPEHHQHVGQVHVRPLQRRWVGALFGEAQRQPQLGKTFFGAAEIGEVRSERRQRAGARRRARRRPVPS